MTSVDQNLLEALLDSWDRNNTIMLNLLRALPDGGLEARAAGSSPTVAQQFMHLHHERLVSVFEEAPEFAIGVPRDEWGRSRGTSGAAGDLSLLPDSRTRATEGSAA